MLRRGLRAHDEGGALRSQRHTGIGRGWRRFIETAYFERAATENRWSRRFCSP